MCTGTSLREELLKLADRRIGACQIPHQGPPLVQSTLISFGCFTRATGTGRRSRGWSFCDHDPKSMSGLTAGDSTTLISLGRIPVANPSPAPRGERLITISVHGHWHAAAAVFRVHIRITIKVWPNTLHDRQNIVLSEHRHCTHAPPFLVRITTPESASIYLTSGAGSPQTPLQELNHADLPGTDPGRSGMESRSLFQPAKKPEAHTLGRAPFRAIGVANACMRVSRRNVTLQGGAGNTNTPHGYKVTVRPAAIDLLEKHAAAGIRGSCADVLCAQERIKNRTEDLLRRGPIGFSPPQMKQAFSSIAPPTLAHGYVVRGKGDFEPARDCSRPLSIQTIALYSSRVKDRACIQELNTFSAEQPRLTGSYICSPTGGYATFREGAGPGPVQQHSRTSGRRDCQLSFELRAGSHRSTALAASSGKVTGRRLMLRAEGISLNTAYPVCRFSFHVEQCSVSNGKTTKAHARFTRYGQSPHMYALSMVDAKHIFHG
ncbi:uncharacterized protein LAESUDRAFT_749503 [Laetiporus sulphureus 93-53]|uniref:Uncharacterized protein n=1 Tax=Laetiporus sulphureus 93-53 TaxID=1314785 RepID=A0A165EIQ9_9APHY|nr:uncharacterized protein LAESUDRAFT_749503 [Laetiporus sulphureus 93-53]KZT07135.1 hypothetical protein LAESUDRAFT_749503 [Laetiporus sulphureus 93-53]